jgi:hypothetical protein
MLIQYENRDCQY